ncbi:MAG: response regulator [Desulfococcaceae bacterium]
METSENTALKAKILIVDDTLQNLQMLSEMLTQKGYSVTGAPDGPTALMIAANDPPDLILLDILMPGMDGYEVCRQFKTGYCTDSQHCIPAYIPVIFLSALEDTETKIKGFQAGGVDFITKPFQPEEVTARIDTHLKLRNFQKQLEEQNSRLQTEIAARRHAEEELKKHSGQLEKLVMERTAELMWENSLNERMAAISADLLAAEYDIAKIAGLILGAAKELTGSSDGYVAEINLRTKECVMIGVPEDILSSFKTENRQSAFPIGPDGKYIGLSGHSLNTGEPFYTNDPKNHPFSKGIPEGHVPVERFLSVPVFLEGKLRGQISLGNPPRDYTDGDLNAVKRLAGLYALAIQRCQYEREKESLKQQVQKTQRMEALGTLAGGIAHDFNNILFPILGYSEMMSEDLPEGSSLRDSISQILQGVHRATQLVKQILTFCRQAEQKPEPLQIHLIIKEVLKLIRASFPSTIQICQNIRDCGMVIADPTQIHQMAMNLITNAFHAMEEKGGMLTVSLDQVQIGPEDMTEADMLPGEYICLTVADTGTGMDKAVMEHMFDPYFTTKKPEKGTGLGLAVVHGIVKSCYGGIRVSSEPGKGSEFKIWLPLAKNRDIRAQINQNHEPLPRGNENILIVDDELQILKILKQMLERIGYQITARTGSIEALEAFKANPYRFSLIVTDFTMPNMTGLGLAKEVLSIRSDIPIIMCSGFSEQVDAEKAKACGIKEYLIKPVAISDLARSIRRVLSSLSQSKALFPLIFIPSCLI